MVSHSGAHANISSTATTVPQLRYHALLLLRMAR